MSKLDVRCQHCGAAIRWVVYRDEWVHSADAAVLCRWGSDEGPDGNVATPVTKGAFGG